MGISNVTLNKIYVSYKHNNMSVYICIIIYMYMYVFLILCEYEHTTRVHS